MSEHSGKFESWAILEVMGHQKFAGFVSEETIGGSSFVRVDVPEIVADDPNEKREKFTKLFGGSSIYCITPVTEEVARRMVLSLRQRPMNVFDLRLPTDNQKSLTYADPDDGFEDDSQF